MLNWAIGIDMYTLMCIKLMTNKNLQYKKQTNKTKNKTKKKRGQPWLLGHLLFCSSSLSLLCLFLCPPSNVSAPLGLAGSLLTVHTLPGGTFT